MENKSTLKDIIRSAEELSSEPGGNILSSIAAEEKTETEGETAEKKPVAEEKKEEDLPRIKRESPVKLILIILLCISLALLGCAFAYIQLSDNLANVQQGDGLVRLDKTRAPWFTLSDNTISLDPSYEGALPEKLDIPDYFEETPVYSISDNGFKGCEGIKQVTLGEKLTEIGKGAFAQCAALESFSAKNIEEIKSDTFSGCTALEAVVAPKVRVVYPNAFFGCESLRSFLSEELISIGNNGFEGCASLETVNTNKIEKYGKRAFALCAALPNVYIADGAVLGEECFMGATSLKSVTYAGKAELSKAVFKDSGLEEIALPKGEAKILESMFEGCDSIKKAELPEEITSIGKNAFKNCEGLEILTVPKSVKKLGEGAFEGCISLVSIKLEAQIKSLPKRLFKGCDVIQTAVLPEKLQVIGEEAFMNCSYMPMVNIPFGVTEIGERAFSGCTYLERATLPTGITAVGAEAFADCASLKAFDFPTTVTSIGEGVLRGCSSLEVLGIYADTDEFTAIMTEGCTSLKKIVTSNFSTKYAAVDGVLFNADKTTLLIYPAAKGVAEYILPDTVMTVDSYAFKGCDLQSVDINNAEMVMMNAFEGCNSLHTVVADNVYLVGYGAFLDCTSLYSVTFSPELSEIGGLAFSGCPILRSITLPKAADISDDSFESSTVIEYFEKDEPEDTGAIEDTDETEPIREELTSPEDTTDIPSEESDLIDTNGIVTGNE